ncbi:MAG: AMP-binding protein, partial [Actinobacteria bacterium]|nr:AMP-binding protein [Actinomycetota bacterium]
IPLRPSHPSFEPLRAIADGIAALAAVPMLLVWGPNDPVFSDRYLTDLMQRAPHADVHRFEQASHLVIEDAPEAVASILAWISERTAPYDRLGASANPDPAGASAPTALLDGLVTAAVQRPESPALIVMGSRGVTQRVTWGHLNRRVAELAAGLTARGVQPGDRVSVLVPPGADLLAIVYGCWTIGASAVVADTGLGIAGIRRAIRGARPQHVIGVRAGMALARTVTIPGLRLSVGALPALAAEGAALLDAGWATALPDREAEAVVVFTSGATGPAKGVVYRHRQIAATVDVLRRHYALGSTDSLVAAFAPWAVLGPALGLSSVIPSMDVTKPATLTALALSEAVAAVDGTVLWASPAALANVLATAGTLSPEQRAAFASLRLALFAGAPVPVESLKAAATLMPNAQARTPYGMTEALPIADTDLDEIEAAGPGNGVLVGWPVSGVQVAIAPLSEMGLPSPEITTEPGMTGEVAVRADHMRDHYDRLWATNRMASANDGWHRTGDVGHLDEDGRLWIEGRLAHVIVTDAGPLTPVGPEQRAISVPFVDQAALVSVGPRGTAHPVLVVVVARGSAATALLDPERTAELRQVTGVDLAAVLCRGTMPVDIRHNAKIDRSALSRWAESVLAGAVR